jgi:hypothetical protein
MKKRVMNLVNFVRGCVPRDPQRDLYLPIKEEIAINKQYGFEHTVLLQYDALLREDMVELIRKEADEHMELGLWFEMCRDMTEAVGIPWRGRPGYDWDWYVNPGFLPAYTLDQREALIDEAFRLFKEIFGFYPKVAGSWLLDSHSVAYMSEKYDLDAICICREQWGVDAYTLWGGYYNGGYFPARNNMLCPAQSPEAGVKTPIFRMLGPDPTYNYDDRKYGIVANGCSTLEPCWTIGSNPDAVDLLFRTYYENPCLTQSHATTGQENSFGWGMIERGYRIQAEKLDKLAKEGKVVIEKLGETGADMRRTAEITPAVAMVAYEDWAHDGSDPEEVCRTVWYNCASYRANLFFKGSRLFFRDIYKFDDRYAERYITKTCEAWDAIYDTLPMVNGRLAAANGRDSAIEFAKTVSPDGFTCIEHDQTLEVRIRFADGTEGIVLLAPDGIKLEGCGELTYLDAVAEDTTTAYGDGAFRFVHNHYAYEIPVQGTVEPLECGYRLTGDVALVMDKR